MYMKLDFVSSDIKITKSNWLDDLLGFGYIKIERVNFRMDVQKYEKHKLKYSRFYSQFK